MRWGTRLLLGARGSLSALWLLSAPSLLSALAWADAVSAQDLDDGEMYAPGAVPLPNTLPEPAPVPGAVVHLTWEAPAECPQREEVLALVQIPERAPGNLIAHAIVREAHGEYHLSLTTEQEGQKGHRSLTAANCGELGEVTAALLSLSLASVDKAEESPPPVEPPAQADTSIQLSQASEEHRHRTSLWVDLGVRAAVGPLPRSSAGPMLRLALERHHLRVELGGYGLMKVRSADESLGRSGYLLLTGILSSCFLSGNDWRWGGCAGVEVGVIEGESEGISQVGRSVQPWLTPHAALVVGIQPGPFAVQLRPVLGVPLIRPRFSIEPFGTVFQPSAVLGAIELSVGLRF